MSAAENHNRMDLGEPVGLGEPAGGVVVHNWEGQSNRESGEKRCVETALAKDSLGLAPKGLTLRDLEVVAELQVIGKVERDVEFDLDTRCSIDDTSWDGEDDCKGKTKEDSADTGVVVAGVSLQGTTYVENQIPPLWNLLVLLHEFCVNILELVDLAVLLEALPQ
ncbi:hypothetical protein HG530_013713 [Fusarium avenaceum]|nr:hypothetical protein HG530_013713 [Fusarium avenaceum]